MQQLACGAWQIRVLTVICFHSTSHTPGLCFEVSTIHVATLWMGFDCIILEISFVEVFIGGFVRSSVVDEEAPSLGQIERS